mmetsp:Transcript_12405/g.49771  ORF Transcript_12405/g.49771 Transcript_12405/m.49771 type:complete len:451 (+) Transcript_12405:199-1551(+)
MTLRELARETHLRSSRCQQAILVMIRHNNIRIMQQENNDEEDNLYQINLEAVLYRLRYPRYLLHIRECYGKTQELLFEVLFQHGMLHTHELFARISFNQYRLDISRTNTTILEQALSELVDLQLIEIVPSKLDSVGSIIDFDISVSAKAAREDFRSNDVLWRVNFGHINRCLQHVACAELVREEVNESASRLLLAMLEISRLHGHITNDGAPVQLSEADILERLISDFPQKSASEVEVSLHECLTTLQNDPWKLLSAHLMDSAGNIQERYSVDFSRILDMIRVKELEAVVRERFGGPACRIFRLLLLKHNLEQKQIAEMAMISIKDTRELLYKLLKAHYVQIQEVARTVDHAPSRTFYLWHVNLSHVSEHIERELYRALSNLRARMMYEMLRQQEVVHLLERIQDRNLIPLTASQRMRVARMKSAATQLESSLLRLDELVLVFSTVAELH